MNNYFQDTDTGNLLIHPSERESVFTSTGTSSSSTYSGSSSTTIYTTRAPESRGFERSRQLIQQLEPGSVQSQVHYLLNLLQFNLVVMKGFLSDHFFLPKLQSHLAPDGSVLMEWISSKYRLGFNIEIDPSESSWFLVSSEDIGGLSASGQLNEDDIPGIIWTLAIFLMNYS